MFFVIFFLYFCKEDYESGKQTFFASLYNPNIGIGYVFIANLIASAATVLMLLMSARLGNVQRINRYEGALLLAGFIGYQFLLFQSLAP